MRNLLMILALLLTLPGCSYFSVHKMDVQQGNIITPEMAHQIHRGMTVSEVKDVLGNPVLTNVFDANRIDYVYTLQGYEPSTDKYLTLTFRNGRVSSIEGNMYSQFMQ